MVAHSMKRANGKLSNYYGKFEFRIVKYSNIGIIYKPISLGDSFARDTSSNDVGIGAMAEVYLEGSFSWSLDTNGWKRAEISGHSGRRMRYDSMMLVALDGAPRLVAIGADL